MRAEDQRSELRCPGLVWVTAALGADFRVSVFPTKKGSEKYSSSPRVMRLIAAMYSESLGLNKVRTKKDLLSVSRPLDEAASALQVISQTHLWPYAHSQTIFPFIRGSGTKLNHAECVFWHSLPYLKQCCHSLTLVKYTDPQPQLCSLNAQSTSKMWQKWLRKSHQVNRRKEGGGSCWLSAKSLHSGFSFLVSALCWKVSTYALVSMATAFLAFLLRH